MQVRKGGSERSGYGKGKQPGEKAFSYAAWNFYVIGDAPQMFLASGNYSMIFLFDEFLIRLAI